VKKEGEEPRCPSVNPGALAGKRGAEDLIVEKRLATNENIVEKSGGDNSTKERSGALDGRGGGNEVR